LTVKFLEIPSNWIKTEVSLDRNFGGNEEIYSSPHTFQKKKMSYEQRQIILFDNFSGEFLGDEDNLLVQQFSS